MAEKKAQPRRAPAKPSLLQNKRFVMGISLLLAIVAWVVFAVVEGDEQVSTITVPVRFELSVTAQERGLQAFWEIFDPNELAVDVTYRSMRYVNVRPEDFDAFLMTDELFRVGEFSLNIRVRSRDPDRVTYVESVISGTDNLTRLPLFIDYPGENTFDLVPEIIGEVDVPDGYFPAELVLLQRSVRITGPQSIVREVDRVIARVTVEDVLEEDTRFDDVEIIPVDANGSRLRYLTVEDEVSAVIPVWSVETLRPAVEFLHLPSALQGNGNGLRYSVSPESVTAALPANAIAGNGEHIIGSIHSRAISPEHSRFRFYTEEMAEIYVFNGVEAFEVEVDLEGFDTITLTLPGNQISLPEGSGLAGQFSNVANVTIVGPADVLEELTAENLSGMVTITEDTERGSNLRFALEISVERDDSWVFGEHTVLGTVWGE